MRIKVSPPAPAGFSARCGDPRRASFFDGGDIIFLAGKEQESAGISLSGSA